MAHLQEIRSKIGTVQNLQKLTRAMEMVARSKIGKIKMRMESAQPFAEKMRVIAAHMHHARLEYHSAYLAVRPVKRIGLILVTSDKGMCGGLNTRLFRLVAQHLHEWTSLGQEVEVCALGNQGLSFVRRMGLPVVSQAVGLGDLPLMERLVQPVGVLLQSFREGRIDEVHLAYSHFANVLVQRPLVEPLLPLTGERLGAPEGIWDYLYEPDPRQVIDGMLRRYLETLIWLAVAENMASEQGARMMAMKAASDNAKEALEDLNHVYHRSRQEQITRELIEISSGAAATGGQV
ncbi:MAG: ATP synthase F1 subunit gamma [Ferrovum sp.]|nr:ATP synthase F1 subunit gamma [Ferrovum sp.]NDU88101.1 ATP synthase F1 subunit gamma [Ferrovum sp.]